MDISQNHPNITDLSNELLCNILKYLPLRETLSVGMLCRKLLAAVDMHLRLCKTIDFCQDSVYGYMPGSITDDHMHALFKKCPFLETVYGLHPTKVERRRLRKRSALTVPGIIEALSLCYNLQAVETSDLRLFEAIMLHLPQIEIVGHFQNRDGVFPPNTSHKLRLQPYPRISSLHLIGVEIPELTAMPHVQHLHLQCVRFTKLQPFRLFLAHNLKSFVMKHCMGPTMSLRYLSLIIALSSSPHLSHLELVRVPLPGGLFQRAVEDSHRHQGFVNLKTLVVGGCKGMLEADIGHLMIVSSKNLETLYIQPSLTKDSLFVSLSYAQCSFPNLRNLHLGYMDTLNSSGEWSEEALLSLGLAEVPDTPSSITDSGMKVISELFPHIKTMSVSNCPHLMVMYQWMPGEGLEAWSELTDLTLQKCHCLQLSSFALFISLLPCIQVVILRDMFREPPKGCSHVGLSAGTGLGMSSAVVSNQDEHIAVQGHHQDFDHPGEEDNEENERDLLDMENDDNQEPHFMVLQRDFFDGEDDDEAAGEGQADNPEVLDDQDDGFNVYENRLDDNHHPFREINNNDSDASNNNYNPPNSSSHTTNNEAPCTRSKYHLRQTPKRLSRSTKSVGVQADVDFEAESCDQSANMNPLIAKEVLPDSDDSSHFQNVKNSKIHSNQAEYDPCRPSTSKAGQHLDYTYSSDSKSYNMSDSEVDSDSKFADNPKGFKRQHSPIKEEPEHEYLEVLDEDSLLVGANLSINSEEEDTYPEDECKCPSSDDMSDDSDVELSYANCGIGPSLYSDYKLSKPCHVIITKLHDTYSEASNSAKSISEVIPEAEESDSINSGTSSPLFHSFTDYSNDGSDINNSYRDTSLVEDMKVFISQDSSSYDSEDLYNRKYDSLFLNGETGPHNDCNSITVDAKTVESPKTSPLVIPVCNKKKSSPPGQCCVHLNKIEIKDVKNGTFKSNLQVSEPSCSDVSTGAHITDEKNSHCLVENEAVVSRYICEDSDQVSEDLTGPISTKNLLEDDCIGSKDNIQTSSVKILENPSKVKESVVYNLDGDEHSSEEEVEQEYMIIDEQETSVYILKQSKSVNSSEIEQHYMITDEQGSSSYTSKQPKPVDSSGLGEEYLLIDKPGTSNYISKQSKTSNTSLKESKKQFSKSGKGYPDAGRYKSTHAQQHSKQNKINNSVCDDKNEMSKLPPCYVVVNRIETDSIKEHCKNSTLFNPNEPSTSNSGSNDENSNSSKGESIILMKDESKPQCNNGNQSLNATQHSNEIDYSNDNSMSDDNSMQYVVIDESKNEETSSSSADSECRERKRNNAKGQPSTLKTDTKYDLSFPSTSKSGSVSYISDAEDESSNPPRTKKLKKSLENQYSDEFYIQVPNNTSGSIEVVNLNTGLSHKTASCSVILHRIKTCKKHGFPKGKRIQKSSTCKNAYSEQLYMSDFDPNIPSTSKVDVTYESKPFDTRDNNCVTSSKHKRGRKRSRKSEETVSHSIKMENRDTTFFCDQPSISSSGCVTKEETECSLPIPAGVSDSKTERLKVTSSDAAVLLSEKKGRQRDNFCRNDRYACCIYKNKHHALKYHRHKHHTSSRNLGQEYALKYANFCRRMRRSRSRRFKYFLRNLPESKNKYPSVPMMTLVSQGTQATSADIRRAIRRVRRVTSQVRRPIYSSKKSTKSSHCSKISSKVISETPISNDPRPESFDKATSTSDPLLEDDAVQTLQLSSSTLLSFTIVSCGISDLIIERCPKLFHVEVQACRILKKFQMNYCPSMKRVNVSQCPKLNICALVSSVLSLTTDSYFLVSYEPCMQGYHPGDGEKAILSKIAVNQSVLLCHDFYDASEEAIQASFKEKMLEWCRYMFRLHATLNYTREKIKRSRVKSEEPRSSEYPWSHDLRRIHGQYVGSSDSEFCCTDGRYDLLTNNPLFGEIFDTHKTETGFPCVNDCEAVENNSLMSHEAVEKYFKMQKKFIGFYIPVTENNRTNVYD